MSGLEIVGLVLGLYPIVQRAVQLYGEAKPGHTASSLVRKLKTESIIYDQFVKNLLEPVVSSSVIETLLDRSSPSLPEGWKDTELHKELFGRLGPMKAAHLLDLLHDMNKLLKGLESELTNISRGTEVLEKFRTRLRAARANSPKSRVQTNLGAVSEINRDLRRLLESDAIAISHSVSKDELSKSEYIRFLHRENIDLRELYDMVHHSYACECPEPHLATLACHCPSCQTPFSPAKSRSSTWAPELLLWSGHTDSSGSDCTTPPSGKEVAIADEESDESRSAVHHGRAASLPLPLPELPQSPSPNESAQKKRSCSISVSPCGENEQADSDDVIRDLCAVIRNYQCDEKDTVTILGILEKEDKKFRLSVNTGHGDGEDTDIVRPSDLIKTGMPTLSTKTRLHIAFQLCLAVLQLCTTPWIDDTWTWDEHCVVKKIEVHPNEDSEDIDFLTPQDDSYRLFVTQQFYSGQQKFSKPRQPNILSLLAGEPSGRILVKLGCALIQLGFGKTMQDIRDEKPPNWLGGFEKTLDPASLDFVTATKLLDSGSVTAELGVDYANVVKACLHRQYQDAQVQGIKGFSFRGETFFDCAEEAIINPLFDWVKAFG